ncbi:MAG: hypothetical protein KBT04_06315, partial [Bacteroidales bacterium]|nr:hypothetical protein [Candidatus Colimorpha onthohippi]
MKKISLLCALMLVAVFVAAQKPVVVDKVVAVVGANIVKLSDIENSYAQVRKRQGNQAAEFHRCEILEDVLMNKLLIQKGLMDSVEVSDEEVEKQVDYYLKAYLRQYGTKEALREATGYTYDEFHDVYFDLLHDRIMSQRVEMQLTSAVTVTPQQVREYFNRIPADSMVQLEAEYEVSEITLQPVISEAERDRV